jgi:hypothetical protein
MEESFAVGNDGRPIPRHVVDGELQNFAWSERHGRYAFANADIEPTAADASTSGWTAYALALELLVANRLSSWDVSEGCYAPGHSPNGGCSNRPWTPFAAYAAAQALGIPLRAYTAATPYVQRRSGLLVRNFTRGSVVVNPTAQTIKDPVYGRVAARTGVIGGVEAAGR